MQVLPGQQSQSQPLLPSGDQGDSGGTGKQAEGTSAAPTSFPAQVQQQQQLQQTTPQDNTQHGGAPQGAGDMGAVSSVFGASPQNPFWQNGYGVSSADSQSLTAAALNGLSGGPPPPPQQQQPNHPHQRQQQQQLGGISAAATTQQQHQQPHHHQQLQQHQQPCFGGQPWAGLPSLAPGNEHGTGAPGGGPLTSKKRKASRDPVEEESAVREATEGVAEGGGANPDREGGEDVATHAVTHVNKMARAGEPTGSTGGAQPTAEMGEMEIVGALESIV